MQMYRPVNIKNGRVEAQRTKQFMYATGQKYNNGTITTVHIAVISYHYRSANQNREYGDAVNKATMQMNNKGYKNK